MSSFTEAVLQSPLLTFKSTVAKGFWGHHPFDSNIFQFNFYFNMIKYQLIILVTNF